MKVPIIITHKQGRLTTLRKVAQAYHPKNAEARKLAQRMGIKVSHHQLRDEHADLHLHSWYSDGFFSPTQLATAAHFMGLKAVALLDHESFAGQEEMQAACDEFGITNIPAIEFNIRNYNMDLAGYHMSFTNPTLLRRLNEIHEARQAYITSLLVSLEKEGMKINPLEFFPAGLHSSQQIAEILFRTGKVPSFEKGMDRVAPWGTSDGHGRMRSLYFKLDEALELIHADGGIPIWVHPLQQHQWEHVALKLIERGKWGPEGVMGFELMHGRSEEINHGQLVWLIDKLRDEVGISPILTFGSDYHDGRREQFGFPEFCLEIGKSDEIVRELGLARLDKSRIVVKKRS